MSVFPIHHCCLCTLLHRIERDCCAQVDKIVHSPESKTAEKARKELRESLISIAPIFADLPYFMNEEFTLVDCCLGPILWRLESLGIELPNNRQTQPLHDYMARLFERESFQESLSELERELQA